MSIRFVADTDGIYIRYELTSSKLAMPHMPATGVSGVDLYANVENQWHWLATCQPTDTVVAKPLVRDMTPGKRPIKSIFRSTTA